jgi:hypothetical protein
LASIRELERQILTDSLSKVSTRDARPPEILVPAPGGVPEPGVVERVLARKHAAREIIDLLKPSLLELMLVDEPRAKVAPDIEQKFAAYEREYLKGLAPELAGTWVAYADGRLVHHLYEADYHRLRSSRNLGFITKDEQARISNAKVVVAGLSVGGASAVALAMEGFRDFYVTDMDVLSSSNMNRLLASVHDVGRYKTDLVAEKIWGMNPFSLVTRDTRGYSPEIEGDVFRDGWMPDVFVDAMDSFEAKLAARRSCAKFGVPLVWMADVGDGVVRIGCERYDLDRNLLPFNGRFDSAQKQLGRDLTFDESFIAAVGFECIRREPRALKVFPAVARGELPGPPQLAGTVQIAAGTVGRTVRRLLRGDTVNPDTFICVGDRMDQKGPSTLGSARTDMLVLSVIWKLDQAKRHASVQWGRSKLSELGTSIAKRVRR